MDAMTEPVETAELLAFARTVDARSLSRAAVELRVPRATISRRLARLEQRLQTRLLRRTTRSLVLTDAGEALYRHARIVLDAVALAEASVRRPDDMRGELRVSVPPGLPASFAAMVCDFAARYPDVRVHVHATTRHVDLQRDGYDVAIRASMTLEPGLIARRLVTDRVVAVASPAYLAAHGTPSTRRELARHRCLMGFARGEVPATHWPAARGGKLAVTGVFYANELGLLAEAALRGLGIAFLPLLFMRPLIEDGSLVQVLPDVLHADNQVSVVYAERELMPPQVRAFVDTVVAWAPGALGEPALAERCREEAGRRKRPKPKASR